MSSRLTIRREVELSGTGLFTAKPARVRLCPARDHGISLRRIDANLPEAMRAALPARVSNVQAMPGLPGRNTVLGPAPSAPLFITTEHVLSSLAGLGVTDCLIELDGQELPMFDGSASAFVEAIQSAGLEEIVGRADPLRITEAVRVEGPGGASIVAQPRSTPGCSFSYTLDYAGTAGGEHIPRQTATWDGSAASYTAGVAPARTFCLAHEAVALRQAGLFLHVTPREMLVLDAAGRPVENTLRFSDEPARHKLLDLIGDLALVGRPIQADITATRAGHALNQEMARRLVAASVG
ncbi:MAG: UDP-3-O-acyl-N-acetylglucosamine deacetylase [Phycisphaerales bacterium]|nr:UDP-3-O-acyl-N-acetylglucosamine deacetylase [Phycisphaerales bacterium]MCK6478039.1 UDP-3-O-acyl-N-acetylglucosamine deacetylase [Phycisphaerales bacterium]